jgi:hypothetical protein
MLTEARKLNRRAVVGRYKGLIEGCYHPKGRKEEAKK